MNNVPTKTPKITPRVVPKKLDPLEFMPVSDGIVVDGEVATVDGGIDVEGTVTGDVVGGVVVGGTTTWLSSVSGFQFSVMVNVEVVSTISP